MLLAAPPAHAEWQSIRASDGLADPKVYSILEDGTGSMWFGTPNGASHFDGLRWSTERASLPNPSVLSVLEDRRGALWLGTDDGLARRDGDRWTTFSYPAQLPQGQVNALLEDQAGDIWIGTSNGVTRFTPGTGTFHPEGVGQLVYNVVDQIVEGPDHSLWFGTPNGVSHRELNGAWTNFTTDTVALACDSVLAVARADDGAMWFGTARGPFRYANGSWTRLRKAAGGSDTLVTALAADHRGGMWMGGQDGLIHYAGGVGRGYTATTNGQSFQEITTLDVDRSGNLWVATRDNGLFRYDGVDLENNTSTCTAPPNVPSLNRLNANSVEGLEVGRQGVLWVSTFENGGLNYLDRAGSWRALRAGRPLRVPATSPFLLEDRTGTLWCGSKGEGLASLDSTRTYSVFFTRTGGLPSDSVSALALDAAGRLWVGTANGLARYDTTGWATWLTNSTPGPDSIRDIVEDGQQRLWISSSRGLYSLDPTRTTLARATVADAIADSLISILVAGRNGRVLAGTRKGLSVLDQGHWTSPAGGWAPGDSDVTSLMEDSRGRIWFGTYLGITRYNGNGWDRFPTSVLDNTPINALLEDRAGGVWAVRQTNGAVRYNGTTWRGLSYSGDGLISREIKAIAEDTQGHLWFAGPCGLSQYSPDRTAPQTLILSKPPALIPVGNVQFVFGAAYGESADLEFSTSWDGVNYSPWSTAVSFNREGIPDGRDTLRVRARDWTGNVDPTPAIYAFEVDATPPDAVLSSPTFGQPVRGTIELRGTAQDARFANYRVEVRRSGLATWTGPGVTLLNSDTLQVQDGRLATWDTTTFPEGLYDVRLAVRDNLGLIGTSPTTVMVDNLAPFADVTSPRRIPAGGGDVYSTLGEVHIYFPPGALTAGDSVLIVPADTSPASPAVVNAYAIAWQGAALRKPAVLEMTQGDSTTALSSGAIEIRRLADDGTWAAVGGTRNAFTGKWSALITTPGTYALVRGGAAAASATALSPLSMSPRALSLSGGYGGAGIAIGFSLGRSATASLRVYNRAGHFVRELASGVSLNAGANMVRWDGRDREGRMVREGLYLVSVEALGTVQTRTVAVVP